jgi:hypothetical protein
VAIVVNVKCFMIPNNVARRQHCKHKLLWSEYPKLAIKWPLVKDNIRIARPVVDIIE